MHLQQPPRHELLLHLPQLHRAHARTKRRQLAHPPAARSSTSCDSLALARSASTMRSSRTVSMRSSSSSDIASGCCIRRRRARAAAPQSPPAPHRCSRSLATANRIRIARQISRHALVLKSARLCRLLALRCGARCRLDHLLGRAHHRLRTPRQPIHLAQPALRTR